MSSLRFLIFTLLGALASSAFAGEPVDLGYGTVGLPDGFKHVREQGFDSTIGHFISADGRLEIQYDIGIMAGVLCDEPINPKDLVSSTTTKVHGLTVQMIVVGKKSQGVIVSIRDAGPANFMARVRDDKDIEIVKKLVMTFKPEPNGLKPTDPPKPVK